MDKQDKLKKSFILCAVVAVVIIGIFIASIGVNQNVAKNLEGAMAYTCGDSIKIYDFYSKKTFEIASAEGNNAAFDGKSGILYYGESDKIKGLYRYDTEKNISELVYKPAGELICFDCQNGLTIGLIKKNNAYDIFDITNPDKIFLHSSDEITEICLNEKADEIYFIAKSGEKYKMKSISLTGQTKDILEDKECISEMSFYNNQLLYTKGSSVYAYNVLTAKDLKLEFKKNENVYKTLKMAGKNLYIVSHKINDDYVICVCNGSNIKPVEATNSDSSVIILDYIGSLCK